MKALSFFMALLISTFFIQSNLLAQYGWVQQTSNLTIPISKISFINENTGWCSAAGGAMYSSRGSLIKTTNGGQNWNILYDGGVMYNSFHFVDPNTGWVTGGFWNDVGSHRKYIYISTNGGANWITQYSDTIRGSFSSVHFMNYYYGIVVGTTFSKGLICRTTNAGTIWSFDSLSNAIRLNDIYYMFLNKCWVVGGDDGQIFLSTDMGANWILKYTSAGTTFHNIFFYDPATAWVSGTDGKIAKTTNSGENWTIYNVGMNLPIYGVRFVTPDTGFAVGGNGNAVVLKSTNGGLNWTINTQFNYIWLNSVYFHNNSTGWVAGGVGNPFNIGNIYKTTTGGAIGLKNISFAVPENFFLYQNFPNPFNPITKFKFSIPKSNVLVKLIIYDVLGNKITELVNEKLGAGIYETTWDASNYSSGIYYYTLIAGDYLETKKMILVK